MNLGVTGHRRLSEPGRVRRGIEEALDAIVARFGAGPITLLTPLAEGADRLVADCVLARPNGSLVVPLPLPMEEYSTDFATAESKEEFLRFVAAARQVVDLPSAPTREAAYEAVGKWVLDHCDVVIAVWDGRGGAGTGKVAIEARTRAKPMAWVHAGNLDPTTKQPTSLGPEQGRVTLEAF